MNEEQSRPIRVPSLQIEFVDDDNISLHSDAISMHSDAISLHSDAILFSAAQSYSSNISYLKPPPTTHSYLRKSLIILSPISPNKR